jgi:DNA-binding LacI/PurR family transcriptional regulator
MPGAPIVVAAGSFTSTYSIEMVRRIQMSLRAGEAILKCPTTAEPEIVSSSLMRVLADAKPAALIGICIRPDPAVVAAFRAAGAPVVLIDEEVTGATTITLDNFLGGFIAADHLVKRGCKSIAVVRGKTGQVGDYNALQRIKGFERALAAKRLTMAAGGPLDAPNYSMQDGERAMSSILDRGLEVDGIFSAAGDLCALGVLKVALARGRRIPEDLAVVGFDDLDMAAKAIPPLTTVRQPLGEMASAAYDAAVVRKARTLAQSQKIFFKPTLAVRGSA